MFLLFICFVDVRGGVGAIFLALKNEYEERTKLRGYLDGEKDVPVHGVASFRLLRVVDSEGTLPPLCSSSPRSHPAESSPSACGLVASVKR
jgi:hypothetical protein